MTLRATKVLLGLFCMGATVVATPALADSPTPTPPSTTPAATTPATARGLLVVAVGATAEVAWPLARAVYAQDALRPAALDEPRARVLAGELPNASASRESRDLAETRAAIHGDDAPSRQLLMTLAVSLHVLGVVVVETTGLGAEARVFVASSGAFDAARYVPDPVPPTTWGTVTPTLAWSSTVDSLRRTYAPTQALPVADTAPSPASSPVAGTPSHSDAPPSGPTPFYLSPWFWGAVGAAAFGAGAIYFATRDNGSSSIQLQVQVPR